MANYPRWFATVNLRDNANRASSVQFYVPEATAKLYFAAADKTARDATAIGTLFAKLLTCTDMVVESVGVSILDETAPVTLPASGVVRGNKIVMNGLTGPDAFTISIPGRKASAFTLKTNSIDIDIEAVGDFLTFLQAVETTCLGRGGLAVDIQEAYLND